MTDVVVSYTFQTASWLAKEPSEEDYSRYDCVWDMPEADVSDQVDDRTWKSVIFNTEQDAIEYAKKYLEENSDNKWVAVAIVIKHTHQTVLKFK